MTSGEFDENDLDADEEAIALRLEVQNKTDSRKKIDLTQETQKILEAEDDYDDFDLLDAEIDPRDVRSRLRLANLEEEVEFEKKAI